MNRVGLVLLFASCLLTAPAQARDATTQESFSLTRKERKTGYLLAERDPERPDEQDAWRITDLPSGHAHRQADLLVLHTRIEGLGEFRPVAYAWVGEARENAAWFTLRSRESTPTAALLAARKPADSEGVRVGKLLGKVLKTGEDGLVTINLGEADGVRPGDLYRVLGASFTEDDLRGSSLGREGVALLEIVRADPGGLTSQAKVRQGSANRNAFVEFMGREQEQRQGEQRQTRILIVKFSGERGGVFSDFLIQGIEREISGVKGIALERVDVPISHVSADAESVRELGLQHGADIVVWGSVACNDNGACVQPSITFVHEEREDWSTRRQDEIRTASADLGSDLGSVDDRALALASLAAGLAFYRNNEYADAAFHLGRAERNGLPEDIERARGALFSSLYYLGDWAGARELAMRVRQEGEAAKDAWRKAYGAFFLGTVESDRGEYDDALKLFHEARASRTLDARAIAVITGSIADILQARGQLDEALRIRQEEQLPVYEKLGDVRSRAITLGNIADILQARGQLDEADRSYAAATELLEPLGLPREQAILLFNRSQIPAARGDMVSSIHLQEEALNLLRPLNLPPDLASALGLLGQGTFLAGQHEAGARYSREAAEMAQRLGDADSEISARVLLLAHLNAQGKKDEAAATDELLTTLLSGLPAGARVNTWNQIGVLAYGKSDFVHALEYQARALSIARATPEGAQASLLLNVASDHLALGHVPQAHALLDECVERAKQDGDPDRLAAALTLRVQVLLGEGNLQGALVQLDALVTEMRAAKAPEAEILELDLGRAALLSLLPERRDEATTLYKELETRSTRLGLENERLTAQAGRRRLAAAGELGGVQGVIVLEVLPGGVALPAGIKAGDLVISYDGVAMGSTEDLIKAVAQTQGRPEVSMLLLTEKGLREIKVPGGKLGVRLGGSK